MRLCLCLLTRVVVFTTYTVLAARSDAAADSDTDVFGDFNTDHLINSIRGAMDTLFDYVGDENGCFYKCPNGVKPVKKQGHTPSANGCGAFGITLDTKHVPAVEKCCNAHDKCYDTCNKPKETCDDDFRDCLTRICKSLKKYVSSDFYDGCKSTADIMYAGTMALGCKPYKDAQKDACMCPKRNTEL